MIIECPDCSARYLVPASVFAAGPRTVRCARCSHKWTTDAPPEIDSFSLDALDIGADGGKAPPAKDPSLLPVIRQNLWILRVRRYLKYFILALLTLLFLVVIFARQPIATTWPSLEPVYEAFGFRIYKLGEGLRFLQVRSEKRYEDGETRLVVEGYIYNESGIKQPVPEIQVIALGPDATEVQSWIMDAPVRRLPSKDKVYFTTSSRTQGSAITEVNLSFVGVVEEYNYDEEESNDIP